MATEDNLGLILSDNTDQVQMRLGIDDDGLVSIGVRDHGETRVLGTLAPGGSITFALQDQGESRVMAELQHGGNIIFALADAEGNETHIFGQDQSK